MKLMINDTHEARFLVAESEEAPDHFEEKMISNLEHPSLLRPESDCFMKEGPVRYEVSGFSSLCEVYENRFLETGEITEILRKVQEAVKYLEGHMLSDRNLLLMPEFIFLDGERIRFAVCRSQGGSFPERMEKLGTFLFLKGNPDSPDTMRLTNEIMRMVMRSDYRLHDLSRIMEKYRQKEEPSYREILPEPEEERERPSFEEAVVELPADERTKRLPVFEKEEETKPKKPERFPGDFEKELQKRLKKEPGQQRGKTLKRALLVLGLLLAAADAVFYFRGKEALLRLLPVFLIAAAVDAAIAVISVILEKHSGVRFLAPKKQL